VGDLGVELGDLVGAAGVFELLRGEVGLHTGSGAGDALADELGIGFIAFHAPTLQIEDISMPVISAKRDAVNFIVDKAFPMEGTDHPDSGILLIDELPQADASVQKTLANLLQEREIKGRKLKPDAAPLNITRSITASASLSAP
jgi:hypothetical protein